MKMLIMSQEKYDNYLELKKHYNTLHEVITAIENAEVSLPRSWACMLDNGLQYWINCEKSCKTCKEYENDYIVSYKVIESP